MKTATNPTERTAMKIQWNKIETLTIETRRDADSRRSAKRVTSKCGRVVIHKLHDDVTFVRKCGSDIVRRKVEKRGCLLTIDGMRVMGGSTIAETKRIAAETSR